MPIQIEINNQDSAPVAEDFLKKIFEKTLLESGLDFLFEKKVSLSLAWVSSEEIQKLNREYRKKDSPTDILSFCEFEKQEDLRKNFLENDTVFLGELVLCYTDIVGYVQKKEVDLRKEIVNVASHGMLHLLGFLHSQEMFDIQDRVTEIH